MAPLELVWRWLWPLPPMRITTTVLPSMQIDGDDQRQLRYRNATFADGKIHPDHLRGAADALPGFMNPTDVKNYL